MKLKNMLKESSIKLKYLISDGFFHIFLGSTLNKAIAFISSVVIVRLVSKVDYGYLTYVDNLYSYIGLFTGLGMSTAIMKFCTTETDKCDDRFYVSFSLKYGCLVQLLLSFFLAIYVSAVDLTFPEARPLVYLKILYPCSAYALTLIQNYLRSQGYNRRFSCISILQTVTTLLASVVLAVLFSIYGVALARYLGIIIATLFAVHYIRPILCKVKCHKIGSQKIRNYLSMSLSVMIADIFTTIITLDELLLVSKVFQSEIITASYKIAVLFPSQLLFISSAIVLYAFPKVAKESNMKIALKKIVQIEIGCLIVSTLVAMVGVFANPLLIRIVYGTEYLDAIPLSNMYWVTFLINAGLRIIPVQMLAATGQAKTNAVLSAITAVVHIIVFYYAIKYGGVAASAVATGVIYLLSAMMSWIALYKNRNRIIDIR